MAILQNKNDNIFRQSGNRDTQMVSRSLAGGNISQIIGTFVTKIIYMVSAAVGILLGMRFILSTIGTNPANMIAGAIYHLSAPLVTPFVGLINYQPHYGISRFDFESLLALMAYGVISWIIIAFINTGGQEQD